MKKPFSFCVALLLQVVVLFSCNESDPEDGSVSGAVGFSASSVNDASRAAVLETGGLKDSGFRVSAYFTGASDWATAKDNANTTPGFMYDQLVTWSTGNNAWEYTPTKYWPKEADGASLGKVSFFAWSANAGATPSANTEAGAPTLTVTVPNTQADQRDLVTGVAVDQTSETVTSTGGVVPFEFSHILSRIGFRAVKEQGQGETVITSLKVRYAPYAVESTGVYTFGKTDPWTPDGSTYMSNSAGDEVVTTSMTVSGVATADAVRVNGDDRYLMLLPQEVKAGAVLLDVSWTVGGTPHTYTVILPRQVWSPGKCHDYNLIVGQTGIALGAVAVNPWDGENLYKTTYTITYNANGGTGAGVVRQVVTNVAYPLDKNTFTPPSADAPFDGWNTKADGSGEDYREGDSFMRTSADPVTLYAQWAGLINLATTTAPAGVTYSNSVFTINSNGKYTVINSTTSKRIVVATGKTVTVTLSDASIDVSGTASACAFNMAGATVTLKLSGNNTLKSGTTQAGVHVPNGANLTIDGFPGGALTVTGGNSGTNIAGGAGIGGNGSSSSTGEAGGNITINSGIVTATGGYLTSNGNVGGCGAGIGGGGGGRATTGNAGGAGGTVTINGGTVTATGGNSDGNGGGGAGIGGGGGGDGSSSNFGGAGGAGGTVTITGGTVTANGGYANAPAGIANGGGAGIGGGGGGDTNASGGAAASYTGPGAPSQTGTTYDSGTGDPRVIATGGTGKNNGQAIGTGGDSY